MLLLSNALVFDGSGADPVRGSLLVDDERISAIGENIPAGNFQTLDCTGLALAPGFIDLHSHSDLQVLEGRREKLEQGVTLEVVGNCGFSPYPFLHDAAALREFGAGILGRDDDGWGWPDASSYLKILSSSPSSNSALSLIGHGSLRTAVCGPAQRAPSAVELDRMAGLLADSLDAGCVGFSTGLMYAPGSAANPEELQHLCRVVAKRGKLYATHMRSYAAGLLDATHEQIDLARRTGCRLQISHLQAAGRANWQLQRPTLDAIEAARRDGIDIEFDIYPYQCGSTVLTQFLPQAALDGGVHDLINRLRDSGKRKAVFDSMTGDPARWNDVTISSVASETNAALIGKTVAAIAALRGEDPRAAVLDILVEEEGAVNVVSFNQSEDNLRELITHPLCSVITDGFYVKGKPHPRLYGTFPELLGTLVRDRRWLSLSEAIHKSTAKPAARLNLPDRGLLKPGAIADIVVFDPDRISSAATYEAPAAHPAGIAHVLKAGKIIHSGAKQ